MLTPTRCVLDPRFPQYFPFGNTRCQNILHDFSATDRKTDVIKVLFLGCGDLRNMLESLNTRGIENFQFYLNDHHPLILARNVALLKIISSWDFNPESQEDFNLLWDIWYNIDWPENTRKRFVKVLISLLDGHLPENVNVPESSFISLKEIWNSWFSACCQTKSESELLMKTLLKKRQEILIEVMLNNYPTISFRNKPRDAVLSDLLDKYATEWEQNIGTTALQDHIRQSIREEARHFVEKGWCRIENAKVVCANPTLLHPTTHAWIMDSCFPFDGYLPFHQNEELNTTFSAGMLTRFCQAKLKKLLMSYRQRTKDVKIFFRLGDAFDFCYNESTEKFDVIDCSNIADHVGLANLINASSLKLSNSPDAILITQSMYWCTKVVSVQQYVEKSLCCSLNMIPTLYGLRLLDHVELGSYSPDGLRSPNSHPVSLRWKHVLPFRNLQLSSSPALKQCFEQLAHRCFSIDGPPKNSGSIEDFKWAHFTPNTFLLMVDSISQRVKIDPNCLKLKIPCAFDLARRTTEVWKNGETILKFTTQGVQTELEAAYHTLFNFMYTLIEKSGSRTLRLVLAPSSEHIRNCLKKNVRSMPMMPLNFREVITGQDIHFIDNFSLELTKNTEDKMDFPKISFILPRDHGLLNEQYLGFVLDLDSWSPLLVFESFQTLRVEEVRSPYPFQPVQFALQTGVLKVLNCAERDDGYNLTISVDCAGADGLNISTSQRKPCKSSHDVVVSLSQPRDVQPLVLSFPYPIMVDEILATLHRNDGIIEIILKKSIFEPWPCQFKPDHQKWDVDSFKPWKNGCGSNSLDNHVFSQLMPRSTLTQYPSLSEVRAVIYNIFLRLKDVSRELYVTIQLKGSSKQELLFRVHRPILTSPFGSPLLILSVLENQNWDSKMNDEVDRIFIREATKENKVTFNLKAEELQLLRFVLRLNSTKIAPGAWQRKFLPLRENNPFITTFISPLYLDLPVSREEYDKLSINMGLPTAGVKFSPNGVIVDDESFCVVCTKKSLDLKRCASCRSVIYCGIECQRSHWAQHKTICKQLKNMLVNGVWQ